MNWFYIVVFLIIIFVILRCVFGYISNYNKIKRAYVKIDESISGIDVALTKRYDILTKMVEVVKEYSKFEQETLFKIAEIRKNMNIKELNEFNNSMTEDFKRVDLVVEKYPKLRANDNYKLLQKSIVDVEEHLQASRRLYNSNVSLYNQLILSFPSNIIAKGMGMKEREFFEAENDVKDNVDVKISDKKK